MNDVYNEIKEEDLTQDLRLICDACGIEVVRILMRQMCGMRLYIPKLSRLTGFINRYFRMHPEKSFKEIACDLKLSEPYIYGFYNREINKEGGLPSFGREVR